MWVWEVLAFDGSASQLQQRWGVVGHVLDEAYDQRIASETELLKLHQAQDLSRKIRQQVIMQTERAQGMEPGRVERTAGQAKNIFNISFIISTTTTITTISIGIYHRILILIYTYIYIYKLQNNRIIRFGYLRRINMSCIIILVSLINYNSFC